MFARSVSIALLALPIFASAVSLPRGGSPAGINNSCNTAATHCCNSVQDAKSAGVSALLGAAGIDVNSITAQVGLNCTPVSVIAAAGNSCSAQPTCCTGNTFNGLVTLGCSPVNANI